MIGRASATVFMILVTNVEDIARMIGEPNSKMIGAGEIVVRESLGGEFVTMLPNADGGTVFTGVGARGSR
jgi:hypothetical protein